MNTLTISDITKMGVAIPNLRQLQLAVESAERRYTRAVGMAMDAWEMFDQAVDDGLPYEVKNDIAYAAELAEQAQSIAWHELDEAKAALLAAVN